MKLIIKCPFKLILSTKTIKVTWEKAKKVLVLKDDSHVLTVYLKSSLENLESINTIISTKVLDQSKTDISSIPSQISNSTELVSLAISLPSNNTLSKSVDLLDVTPPNSLPNINKLSKSIDYISRTQSIKNDIIGKLNFKKEKHPIYQNTQLEYKFSIDLATTVIEQCIPIIESLGLKTEGIYRISGSSLSIKEVLRLFYTYPKMTIRNSVDKIHSSPKKKGTRVSCDVDHHYLLNRQSIEDMGSESVIKQVNKSKLRVIEFECLYETDVHLLTGLIKLVLRDCLEESLFGECYDRLIRIVKTSSPEDLKLGMQGLINQLPKTHVLYILMKMFFLYIRFDCWI